MAVHNAMKQKLQAYLLLNEIHVEICKAPMRLKTFVRSHKDVLSNVTLFVQRKVCVASSMSMII